MNAALAVAVALIIIGALYIHVRWRRSPQAYRAMIVLAGCYLIAGGLLGACAVHVMASRPSEVSKPPGTATPNVSGSAPSAPTLKENYTRPSVPIPPLHYDPAHAVLPDPKLTPGDTIPGVTADDVCTPGWAREHRHVTEAEKAPVYAEYPDSLRTCACAGGFPSCCEVDHLIPLELGGSNDIKNLWPQPDNPRPGDAEKDQLENELHRLVCDGKMSLADAQKCIASDWVRCWETYVVPEYGPQWAALNRHGW